MVRYAISFSEGSGNEHKPLVQLINPSEEKTVILIPGLQSSRLEEQIIEEFSPRYRIVVANYLESTAASDSYSAEQQALRLGQALTERGIDSAHVSGIGFGGLIAVHLNQHEPLTTLSLSLVNAKGVQEYELLGGYHLNHAIYAAQLSGIWALGNLTPHFGWFDRSDYGLPYAKSLYQTDQRLIRPIVKRVTAPTLIINDSAKGSSSEQASREYARLIPQSNLILPDGDSDTEAQVVRELEYVLHPINNSGVVTEAPSFIRTIQSLLPFDSTNGIKAEGFTLFLILIFIVLATLVSEDLTCIGAGLMVARGIIGFWPATLACLFGIFFGDILIYLFGRWLGANALKRAPFKWMLNEKDMEKSYNWFEMKGPIIILVSRFIPGSRFPTYFSAGALRTTFFTFIVFFGIASVIWTPILVGAAVLIGEQLIGYFAIYQDYALSVLIGVLFLLMIVFKVVIPSFTYTGRRLIYGRWKRIRNWEFWPSYLLYLPVVVHVLYISLRYKKITVCTAANPAIPEGGFNGESKTQILDQIKRKEAVARYCLIQADLSLDEKQSQALSFMEENNLSFPVVLKPDKGQRGAGVKIPKTSEEFERDLSRMRDNFIVQEYVEGVEFGVFYYRYPNQASGRLFSITRKSMLRLEGDGKHTLQHLILKDSRAVCLANIHFGKHADHLYNKPEKGELIPLVELGTHARGALFFDANDLITPELTKRMNEISTSFEGFYFGRFDIRVPSEKEFMEGKQISVIELNGVTSESTNIYDPKHSYLDAVKILCRQWSIAFEIGAQNHEKGASIPTFKHMVPIFFGGNG